MRHQTFLGWAGGLVVLMGSVVAPVEARAQFRSAARPAIDMGSGVVADGPAPAVVGEVPAANDTRIRYALPFLSEARRKARTANRYTVARPVYAGRPGVSFAPYSDYYFPRTIGARETVFTTRPGGSITVGEAAFRQPTPAGVPVFPR